MKIRAISSVPRDQGYLLHWQCQREALLPLGLEPKEYSGPFWEQGLERLLEQAISDGFDYALTLDFDMIFERRHVETLINLARTHRDADIIAPAMMKRGGNDLLFGVRGNDGKFKRLFEPEEFEGELTRVHTAHFGLTLIKLAALERMPRPLFLSEPDDSGRWSEKRIDADIHFWNEAHFRHLKIYLANHIRVGHLQLMIT